MRYALGIMLIAGALVFFLSPMELGDVWWHMSSGRWMAENGHLPAEDPFSYTRAAGSGKGFVLGGFWLAQLLLYALWASGGLLAVVAAKAALFTLVLLILWRALRGRGLGQVQAALVLLPVFLILLEYDEARPQTVSFAMTAGVLYLLERLRRAASCGLCLGQGEEASDLKPPRLVHYISLPLMMLAWANMHPGFIIGLGLIALYWVEHVFMCALLRKRNVRTDWSFLVAGLGAMVLSYINPNGFDSLRLSSAMLSQSMAGESVRIHEHLPVMQFIKFTGEPWILIYVTVFAAAGALSFALNWRRTDFLHLVVFCVLTVLAYESFRVGGFYAVVSAYYLGRNLSQVQKPPAWLDSGVLKGLLIAGLAVAILAVGWPRSAMKSGLLYGGIIPEKSASFIAGARLPGEVFHPYEWGGYLMWRLPEYKTFIDGRALGPLALYRDITRAKEGWQEAMAELDINTVMSWPLLPYRNTVPPIVFALLRSGQWKAVYWDSMSLVFVRADKVPEGLAVLKESTVWEVLLSRVAANIAAHPGKADNYVALAEIHMERGFLLDAEKALRAALKIEPAHERALALAARLR